MTDFIRISTAPAMMVCVCVCARVCVCVCVRVCVCVQKTLIIGYKVSIARYS